MKATKAGERGCVVELGPELIDFNEEPVFEACSGAGGQAPRYVILDFAGVQRMNGLGASMLVKLAARARRNRQRLMAFGLHDHQRDILKVTELSQVISVYDDIASALGAAGVPSADRPAEYKAAPVQALDGDAWAKPVHRLAVPPMPPQAWNRNVAGRRAVGPVNGFGQLWQKVYRLRVSDPKITSEHAIAELKSNFPRLQPSYNRFYPSTAGIKPGEIVLIDSSTPGGPVSTGVMVLYADARSFTFITPQGHPESGWVTFSGYEQDGRTTVQIVGLARANDPVYEAAFRAVGSKMQVRIWTHLLTSLAAHLEVPADITVQPTRFDTRMQWSQAGNVWHNAQIRTLLYSPIRLVGSPFRGTKRGKANAG
ncbi:MAG: STAS domain-containing protein [Chloroflexi bacterium]|nr:STAS domain-containing protein [Chloroflexota bacterium]